MSKKFKAIIVDDEPLARQSLKEVLAQFDDIEIVSECSNGYEAIQAVNQHQPNLLFLDIQMPRLDGFDVIELLGKELPQVIFVTAFDQYALKAFETEAIDYLLKPVQPQRLQKTMERIRSQLNTLSIPSLEHLIDHHQSHLAPLNRILIRDNNDVHIIPTDQIIFIEAEDDYVMIHTAEKSHLKTDQMSRLEKILDPRYFCRIHRSYLLNISFLKKIEPYSKESRLAILTNGKKIPISRSGYTRLLDLL